MSTPVPKEGGGPAAPAPKRHLVQTRRPRAERAYLTRRLIFRNLLLGLPALAALGGLVGLAVKVKGVEAPPLRDRYVSEGLNAVREGRNAEALVKLQRVADDWADDVPPPDLFEALKALHALNDPVRATDLLERLAPIDRPGYPPAQVWRAARALDRSNPTRDELAAAEAHLLHAVRAEPQYLEANARLVQVYVNSGRNREAVPYLERASKARPEMLLVLAKIDAVEGERDRAMERLKQAMTRFETISKGNPDDHEARLYWAEAALIMEDFPAAATILKEGFSRSDDPRYSKALGRLYLAWHDVSAKGVKLDLAGRLELLEQGLKYDPGSLLLLDRFSAPLKGGGALADKALASLREQIEKGRDTAAVRYALGVHAFETGDLTAAREHWEKAHALAPTAPYFANNLAYVLAFGPSPDYDKALEVIHPVVERWPGVMAFRDTRGQVYAKLGRWYDARAELEEALRIGPATPEVRLTLAEAYDRLDEPEKAAEQRKLAATP